MGIEALQGQIGAGWSEDPLVAAKKGLGLGVDGLKGMLDGGGAMGGMGGMGEMIKGAIDGIMQMVGGLLGGGGGGGGMDGIGGAIGSLTQMASGGGGPGSFIGDLGSFAESDMLKMG